MRVDFGNVAEGIDSSGNPLEAGSTEAQNARLANMGEAPLLADKLEFTANDYLRLAGASIAWLAIPAAIAAGPLAAGGAAIAATRQLGVGAPAATVPGAGLVVPSGAVGTPTAAPTTATGSWFARLLAFAFPRRAK